MSVDSLVDQSLCEYSSDRYTQTCQLMEYT